METEQQLLAMSETTDEPVVSIALPVTSWYDTLGELYFAQFESERHLDRIKFAVDLIEQRLTDLDLPLSREEYNQQTHPENNTYKNLGLILDSEPRLLSTPESK
jgi:hypothetical protein